MGGFNKRLAPDAPNHGCQLVMLLVVITVRAILWFENKPVTDHEFPQSISRHAFVGFAHEISVQNFKGIKPRFLLTHATVSMVRAVRAGVPVR